MIALPGGVEECCRDVVRLKKGVVCEDFFTGSTCGEKFEEIHDAKPGTADAGAAAAFARFYGDAIEEIQGLNLRRLTGFGEHGFQKSGS